MSNEGNEIWRLYQTDDNVRIIKNGDLLEETSIFVEINMNLVAEFEVGSNETVDFFKMIEPDIVLGDANENIRRFNIKTLTIDGEPIYLCKIGSKLCLWLSNNLNWSDLAFSTLFSQAKQIIHKIKPE